MKAKTTITYGQTTLDIINSSHELVPNEAKEILLPPSVKKALAVALKKNYPALLLGDTGTGKTSAVKYLAFKLQQPYVRVNMTGFTSPDDLVGSKSVKDGATYFEDGIISNAMKMGAILVLDEVNATSPDCLFIIHALLDDDRQITLPNGEVIRPHKDFRVFATANPDYEGTKSLNRAFLDRFPIILEISGLAPLNETKLLVERTGIDSTIAENLVKCAIMARKAYTEQKTLTYISTRSLIQVSNLIAEGMSPENAYISAITNKAHKNEQEAFKDIYNAVFKMPIADSNNEIVIITRGQIDDFKKQIESEIVQKNQLTNQLNEHKRQLLEFQEKLEQIKTTVKEGKEALEAENPTP